jgi:hypothetical protein
MLKLTIIFDRRLMSSFWISPPPCVKISSAQNGSARGRLERFAAKPTDL